MKKLLVVTLAICMLFTVALAEDIDLSGLSYDQLVALKDRINLAIWNSQEWQEVVVPQGLYVVGEDIPAGTWTVKAAVEHFTVIKFGDTLELNGLEVKYSSYFAMWKVWCGKERNYQEGSDPLEFTFTVKDGDYIQVDYASALFTPYHGKQDLGFR